MLCRINKGDCISFMEHYYEGSGRSIARDCQLHGPERNGILIVDPHAVVMARPVHLESDYVNITDPEFMFPPETCNAWYFHLLASSIDLTWLIADELRKYEYYCYIKGVRRDHRLRHGPMSRILSKLINPQNHTSTCHSKHPR